MSNRMKLREELFLELHRDGRFSKPAKVEPIDSEESVEDIIVKLSTSCKKLNAYLIKWLALVIQNYINYGKEHNWDIEYYYGDTACDINIFYRPNADYIAASKIYDAEDDAAKQLVAEYGPGIMVNLNGMIQRSINPIRDSNDLIGINISLEFKDDIK